MDFPSSSAGKKKSTFNAGRPWFDSWVGKITGEGIGYPLEDSWVTLVAQLVENPPATWETWVRSLGWGHPLEKGTATHSSILASRIPWTEEPGRLHTAHGVLKSWTWLSNFHFVFYNYTFQIINRITGLIFLQMKILRLREVQWFIQAFRKTLLL